MKQCNIVETDDPFKGRLSFYVANVNVLLRFVHLFGVFADI